MNYTIPKNIHPEAKTYMEKVVKYLNDNNQLNEADYGALNMLARSYSLYIKAIEDINQNGLMATGSRGNAIPNPAIKIANDAQIQAVKIMQSFFLTAKDRKKMNEDAVEDESSPIMQFINDSKEYGRWKLKIQNITSMR